MIFKSKFSQNEIYDDIIKKITNNELENIVKGSFQLRSKYGALDIKKFRFDKEKCLQVLLDGYKTNKVVKDAVTDICLKKIKDNKDIFNIYKTVEELREYEKTRSNTIDTIMFCTGLWASDDKEKNELGDEIYTKYKERISSAYKEDEKVDTEDFQFEDFEIQEGIGEVDDMKNHKKDIMSMNLYECIETLSTYKEKIENLEKKLEEKDNEIAALKEKAKSNLNNSLKKHLKSIDKNIIEGFNNLKEENINLNKVIEDLKKQNDLLSKEFVKQFKDMAKTSTNDNIKELKKILIETQNTINGALIEDNKKLLSEIKAYIREEVVSQLKKQEDTTEVDNEFIRGIEANTKSNNKIQKTGERKLRKASDDILVGSPFDEEEFSEIFN